MSTYRLRVYDYTMMQSKKFINTPELAHQLSEFEQRLNKYLRAKPLAIAELKQLITKNKSREQQIDKYLDALIGKSAIESAEIVSVTESLSRQRKMKVSYSGTGVSQRLIKPVINSLKSQLVISPNQRNWKSEAKSGPEFLSVEIEDLKNEDLVRIEKILNLHAQ